MYLQLLTTIVFASLSLSANAQTTKSSKRTKARVARDRSQLLQISYASSKWNADSRKIDSAYLILIDKKSGKTVQVVLDETEPDSSQFSGFFSLRWEGAADIQPQIYVPPFELRDSEKNYKKVFALIQSNGLAAKPILIKKSEKSRGTIEVFDSAEQANAARVAYEEQQKASKEMKASLPAKAAVSAQALAAAALAEQKAKLAKLALEATKREADRVRLEQIEKEKAAERLRQAQLASEKEKAERRAKAKVASEKGLQAYATSDFVNAENLFKQSVELDPENTQFYFQYGVTLYRNQKYNEALVILKLAKVDPRLANEKTYYMALNYYRLNELKPALASFENVGQSTDPVLRPSALFYAGVIQFAENKLEESKKNFETVIDISTDPRLDEQAEAYIDRIANQMMFRKMAETKWTLVGVLGLMYDSNVLLAPDSAGDQGSSTDTGDMRLLTVGSIDYRPLFTQHHEWSANATATLMNSAKNESAQADPYQYAFALPYSYKGTLGKRGLKLTAKPSSEILYLDPDGTGSKVFILSSYLLNLEGTLVMSPTYFATYAAEYRMDDSQLPSSTGDNDLDANKYTARTTQTFFLDKSRKRSLAANIGYVMNSAKGKNRSYDRVETGVTYTRPFRWESSLSFGVSAFKLDFNQADPKRNDTNYTLNVGLTKPVKEWLIWGVTGSYSQNKSNQPLSFEYDRWSVTTTATFMNMF